jgi:hypothetical protein
MTLVGKVKGPLLRKGASLFLLRVEQKDLSL